MKKRMIAFFAMLLMMLSCIPVGGLTIADAAEDLIMKLHYHRPDNSYDGWTVWTWAAGMDGADYVFAEEDGEMVATLTIAPGVTSVGFIVRTQDWVKDVDADQFIDIAEMVSGTVHIYVESGVEGYTKEYGDDAVIGVRLSKARFDGEKTIVATFTGKLEEDLNNYFTVTGPSGTVAIEKVEAASDTEYHVVLAEEINPSKSYKITCDGSEYNVVMPILFSTPKFEEEYTYTGNDLDMSRLGNFTGGGSQEAAPGSGSKFWWQHPVSAGLRVSIPLFSGLTKMYQSRQLKNQIAQLDMQRDYTEQQLDVQMRSAINDLLTARETMYAQELTVQQAAKAYDIADTRYRAGAGTILELNTSQVNMVQAQLSYSQAIYDYLTAKAEYDRIAGRER